MIILSITPYSLEINNANKVQELEITLINKDQVKKIQEHLTNIKNIDLDYLFENNIDFKILRVKIYENKKHKLLHVLDDEFHDFIYTTDNDLNKIIQEYVNQFYPNYLITHIENLDDVK